ncbi:DUF3300 domain-containing protein [Candidatus Nitrosacidococcus tergens]|uniref:DUF3300 domain-containing protein n=1 Tax=Candidatus Nitrosacidococcus tergens TaxID=553981 RepID=A0A7G1Q9J1_9GAMM|nr:DUF3300 domain-containing protein [Candidatus Nitrosacidococcus tergens]CAB1275364.1 exported protein of unknown function [Candidatus Nitrosacidococcus tergens]
MKVKASLFYTIVIIFFALIFSPSVSAEENEAFTTEELDQILAPIALYPDSLLAQLLMASTYPTAISEAAKWSSENPTLEGSAAVRAVENRDWDPSVKSMVAFPQILSTMHDNLDWVQRLGYAFINQEKELWNRVQYLRKKAKEAGNLKSNDKYQVSSKEQTIIVQSPNPEVIYVPYYNPSIVYGPWWWPSYPPIWWNPWPGYGLYPGWGGGFAWGGVGISIGTGFFFGGINWMYGYSQIAYFNSFYYPYGLYGYGRHRGPMRWHHRSYGRLDGYDRNRIPYRGGGQRYTPSVRDRAIPNLNNRNGNGRSFTGIGNRGNQLAPSTIQRNTPSINNQQKIPSLNKDAQGKLLNNGQRIAPQTIQRATPKVTNQQIPQFNPNTQRSTTNNRQSIAPRSIQKNTPSVQGQQVPNFNKSTQNSGGTRLAPQTITPPSTATQRIPQFNRNNIQGPTTNNRQSLAPRSNTPSIAGQQIPNFNKNTQNSGGTRLAPQTITPPSTATQRIPQFNRNNIQGPTTNNRQSLAPRSNTPSIAGQQIPNFNKNTQNSGGTRLAPQTITPPSAATQRILQFNRNNIPAPRSNVTIPRSMPSVTNQQQVPQFNQNTQRSMNNRGANPQIIQRSAPTMRQPVPQIRSGGFRSAPSFNSGNRGFGSVPSFNGGTRNFGGSSGGMGSAPTGGGGDRGAGVWSRGR